MFSANERDMVISQAIKILFQNKRRSADANDERDKVDQPMKENFCFHLPSSGFNLLIKRNGKDAIFIPDISPDTRHGKEKGCCLSQDKLAFLKLILNWPTDVRRSSSNISRAP